jgi:hypothetical protein
MRWAWITVVAPLAVASIACGSDNASSAVGGTPEGPVGSPSARHGVMLVRVETGKTLRATPGEGVGVFVQYESGGHWTVWWTCDSRQSSRTCNYEVDATARSGKITNVAGYDGTTLAPPGGSRSDTPAFPIKGSVTNDIQGVTFDTAPGEIIQVKATLDGSSDGSLFYFVDGDKVKDGYHGQLSDPLDFQPTSL